MNQKPYNSSIILGKPPLGSLEDVKTTQEILNDISKFQDTSSEITFNSSSNNNANKMIDSNRLPDNADKFTSYFEFIDKKQIFGNLNIQQGEILNTTATNNNAKDSKLMKEFMRSKKKQKIKKPEDEAPVCISSKHQLTRFNKPEEIIRRYTNVDLQFNIPTNVNLSHIAQFETYNMNMENYFNEENEINLPPQTHIFSDDINSYQTPIDMLKSQNIRQNSNNNFNSNINNNIPNLQYNNGNSNQSQINSNYNLNQIQKNNYQNNSTNPIFNNNIQNSNNYANQPNPNNINNQNYVDNTNQQQRNNNIQNSNFDKLNQEPITNETKIQPISTVSNNNQKSISEKNTATKVPQAPPVPQVPVPQVPSQTSKQTLENPEGDANLRVKLPTTKRASMAEEIFLAAEKKKAAPKPIFDNITNNTQSKPIVNQRRGGLLEALKSDNPMGRLKKAGTLPVKNLENNCKNFLYKFYILCLKNLYIFLLIKRNKNSFFLFLIF